MKKITLVLSVLLAAAVLCSCGSSDQTDTTGEVSDNQSEESLVLKLGVTGPPTDDIYVVSTYFADAVEEVSGGALTIEVIGSGALGNTAQHYAQLREGSLDIFATALDTGTTMIGGEDFAVTVVPYLFKNLDHYAKFLESDVLAEMMDKVAEANNIYYLGPMGFRFPRGLSCKFPVYSVDDVVNLKIRVPDTASMMRIWEAWGANPQVIGSSELYTALEGGMVDAQENDLQTSFNNAWLEVTKYYMELEYIQQGGILYVSRTTWDKLNDQQKQWLQEGQKLGHETYNKEHENAYEELKQKVIETGVEFVDADIESFRQKAKEAAAELDGELWSAGLYDKIAALADE